MNKKLVIKNRVELIKFAPEYAKEGTWIQIQGNFIRDIKEVLFGNNAALAFNKLSDGTYEAKLGRGSSGEVKIVTIDGETSKAGFTFIPIPVINENEKNSIPLSGKVTLRANTGTTFTYKWYKNDELIPGEGKDEIEVASAGIYRTEIIYKDLVAASNPVLVTKSNTVISTNFQVKNSSLSCRSSSDGQIEVLSQYTGFHYTATLYSGSDSTSASFSSKTTFEGLKAGNYKLSIRILEQPDFLGSYNLRLTEPEDLKVYASVNESEKTIRLNLSGGITYFIDINERIISTTDSVISLNLQTGSNIIKVTTDKLCQGAYENRVTLNTMVVYPNPVSNQLNIHTGEQPQDLEFSIIDLGGKVLINENSKKSNELSINVSSLPAGTYFIVIKMTGKKLEQRFIKL